LFDHNEGEEKREKREERKKWRRIIRMKKETR
jgi:hypothetical protein